MLFSGNFAFAVSHIECSMDEAAHHKCKMECPNEKETLQELVDQLKTALISESETPAKDRQKVVDRAQELVQEIGKEEIDPDGVEAKGTLLKKAAENIKEAMPTVLGIATQIIAHVYKMAGM
jgi:hypothetical protein